jgi:hypothetical protein
MAAQDKTAADRLIAAHGQYYTPTASGLRSFHCEATIDWKAMLARFGPAEIPDDNPTLKYLQTVHLCRGSTQGKGVDGVERHECSTRGKGRSCKTDPGMFINDGLRPHTSGVESPRFLVLGCFMLLTAIYNGVRVFKRIPAPPPFDPREREPQTRRTGSL